MLISAGYVRAPGRALHRATLIAACLAIFVAGCSKKSTETNDGAAGDDLSANDGGPVSQQDLLPAGDLAKPPCGNGQIDPNETCDDGNTTSGDGCSSTCQVEIGWQCPTPGAACTRQVYCGDGYVEPPETCDDGNSTPGDGCSGTCQIEPNYVCATPTPPPSPTHEVCTSTIICGDGKVEPGEACDDGDTTGMNGCSADCQQVTAGYTCPSTGGACMKAVALCGNGKIDPGETCDDGNMGSGDGCSSTCQVEPGWSCAKGPGYACTLIPVCGNGIQEQGESCDDGNKNDGDGCSSTCQVENGYTCTGMEGAKSTCKSYVICGDGILEGSETCDAGKYNDTTSLKGCSATCTIDPGWTCPYVNSPCIAASCGDGYVAGSETCDLGANNGKTGSGCTSSCTVATGYTCSVATPGTKSDTCSVAKCGNGKLEPPYEQCDDGNLIPYDGCSPTCTVEAKCSAGSCSGACGDGLKFPDEQCDDGNTISGDGCSSTCMIEQGFTCSQPTQKTFPTSFTVPILYRDMIHVNNGSNGKSGVGPPSGTTANPDFDNPEIWNASPAPGVTTGLVMATLGTDNKPVFASTDGDKTTALLLPSNATSTSLGTGTDQADVYCWWYHDTGCDGGSADMAIYDNPYAKLVYLDASNNPTTLTLTTSDTTPTANSVYTFSSAYFFPLDGLGWNATAATTQVDTATGYVTPPTNPPTTTSGPHNFSFTSELHYIFTYSHAAAASANPPVFTFNGDDDVWAFINGRLVADIGGIHGPETTNFTYTLNTNAEKTVANGGLGLVDGGWYTIDVFQAERHITGSTYNVSLQNFAHVTSVCTPTCGDGIIVAGEACDNGSTNSATNPPTPCTTPGTPSTCTSNNSGPGTAYNSCGGNCTIIGPYCGDHKTENASANPPTGPAGSAEQCDDGVNVTSYLYPPPATNAGTCAPMCKLPASCGDGIVQAAYDEECDDGASNGPSDKCSTTCQFNTYCGDGVVNGSEQCDDGASNGVAGDKCSSTCTFLCGNGQPDPGEACDDGANNMSSPNYDGCSTSCTLGGYCGDGIKNGPEQCDDGTANNTGAYGGCTAMCMLAPYCGDGIKNGTEQCDQGSANSQNAYGPNKCTTTCQNAPYCGDGIVEASFGEQCDGGAGCNSMCMQTIQ